MSQQFMSLKPAGLVDGYSAEAESSAPIVQVSEEEDHVVVSCIFPGFEISCGDQQTEDGEACYQEVGISGVGFVSVTGQPLLPVFRRFLQVPVGCRISAKTQKGRACTFDDILVTPAQENALDTDDDHELEFDSAAYARDAYEPTELACVGEPREMDGYNVVLLEVCPLQYNAKKHKLRGYSNITVTLRFGASDEEDATDPPRAVMATPVNREAYGNLVLNPRRSVTVRPIETGPIIQRLGYSYELLIIHRNTFLAAAQKIADWKKSKGISTTVVDIATIGNGISQIKQYIRTRRAMWQSKLRYVILLGDTNHIVTDNSGAIATDYYYSTATDPVGSSDCVNPALAIGRIPVQTAAEADAVATQIINYEKRPPSDPAYYDRMTVAAYFQDDSPQDGQANRAYMMTMEGIRNHLIAIGKEVQRVYVSNNPNPLRYKDGSSVPTAVRNAIVDGNTATSTLISETSEGQMMIGHRDHGGTTGWSHPSFTNNNLAAITSAYPSIFLSINCLTGKFDYSTGSDCFAEAMLKLAGGAPSLIAATRVSGTWRNDSLIRALFDGLFPGVIATYPGTTASYGIKNNRLGDLLNYAKMYLLVAHGASSGVQDHYEMYHVIGDPTLEIWTAMPTPIRLRLKLSRSSLLISMSSTPANGVLTVKDGNKVLKTSRASSRQIQVPVNSLKALSPASRNRRRYITVCFSAPGCRYTEKRVRI